MDARDRSRHDGGSEKDGRLAIGCRHHVIKPHPTKGWDAYRRDDISDRVPEDDLDKGCLQTLSWLRMNRRRPL